jgi:hypothetical protein
VNMTNNRNQARKDRRQGNDARGRRGATRKSKERF